MKKIVKPLSSGSLFLISGLFFFGFSAYGQEQAKESPALPENINQIVSVSCYPCHSSKGGIMSRSKLNFSEWTQYSTSKQKSKAEKMYAELKKGAMPPKSAREERPETIPTADQIDVIKKWSESFPAENK